MKYNLSHFAWLQLAQLAKSPVWDGDLICKSGRTELLKSGMVTRNNSGINRLTPHGQNLAAMLHEHSVVN